MLGRPEGAGVGSVGNLFSMTPSPLFEERYLANLNQSPFRNLY